MADLTDIAELDRLFNIGIQIPTTVMPRAPGTDSLPTAKAGPFLRLAWKQWPTLRDELLLLRAENAELRQHAEKAEAGAMALKTVIVEATVEPFDVGACYVQNGLPGIDNDAPLAVQRHVLEGVFDQLLTRIEARVPGALESVNRLWHAAVERDQLRADLARLTAAPSPGLVALLRDALVHLEHHADDYHYVTPKEFKDKLRAELAKLPQEGTNG
jgi:hypothetical protein